MSSPKPAAILRRHLPDSRSTLAPAPDWRILLQDDRIHMFDLQRRGTD